MTTSESRIPAGEPLDEMDVERAIADEDSVASEGVVQGLVPVEAAPIDARTSEDLEEELEDGTFGPEEEALHLDDAVTEVLDDERDLSGADLIGEVGDEVEWRMADEKVQDEQ